MCISDILLFFQRLTQIGQILGKSDETIQQSLHACVSMDSLDGVIDDNFHHKLKEKLFDNQTSGDSLIVNQSDLQKRESLEKNRLIEGSSNHAKSDSESGFDESCSQMSRSGIDDRISTLEPESMSQSVNLEKFDLNQLHLELQSVAVDWRPFRNIYTCSCAMPFDHFMKKARLISI